MLNEAIAESMATLKRWMPWADHEPSLSETEENCERAMMRFKEQTDFRLHLFLKDSDVLIGSSGLHAHLGQPQ